MSLELLLCGILLRYLSCLSSLKAKTTVLIYQNALQSNIWLIHWILQIIWPMNGMLKIHDFTTLKNKMRNLSGFVLICLFGFFGGVWISLCISGNMSAHFKFLKYGKWCVFSLQLWQNLFLSKGKPHTINITELPQHKVIQSIGMAVVI